MDEEEMDEEENEVCELIKKIDKDIFHVEVLGQAMRFMEGDTIRITFLDGPLKGKDVKVYCDDFGRL